ncbi:MAG: prepilin-type N-terminal cleavage/methylation domain-containing protein [Candidatus Zixiibacteriota bacterium]
MYGKRIQTESGVTLLEVLVAMIIMAVALLLLLNMAMVALDANDWSNKTTRATQLMQEKLEQLRYGGNLGAGEDTVQGVVRNWRVTGVGSHLRQVAITVSWEDIRANTVTDSLFTLIQTDSV